MSRFRFPAHPTSLIDVKRRMAYRMYVLTFDIEEWFHILDNEATRTQSQWERFESRVEGGVARILDLLAKHDVPATFF